jgi:hypothetical protein
VRPACARAGSARSLTIFQVRPKMAISPGSMSRERDRGTSERVRLAVCRDDSGLSAAQDRYRLAGFLLATNFDELRRCGRPRTSTPVEIQGKRPAIDRLPNIGGEEQCARTGAARAATRRSACGPRS